MILIIEYIYIYNYYIHIIQIYIYILYIYNTYIHIYIVCKVMLVIMIWHDIMIYHIGNLMNNIYCMYIDSDSVYLYMYLLTSTQWFTDISLCVWFAYCLLTLNLPDKKWLSHNYCQFKRGYFECKYHVWLSACWWICLALSICISYRVDAWWLCTVKGAGSIRMHDVAMFEWTSSHILYIHIFPTIDATNQKFNWNLSAKRLKLAMFFAVSSSGWNCGGHWSPFREHRSWLYTVRYIFQ